jgi:signal transduction histidine kinase
VTLSVTARPLDPASGHAGAVAVFRDVTAERQRRDELAAFAGVVAHDLQSPLTAVDGYLALLALTLESLGCGECQDCHDHRPELTDFVDRAAGAAGRMHRLILGLLEYVTARDATLDRHPVDLGALAGEVVDTYREDPQAAAVAFTVDSAPGSTVRGDRERLRQVVENLVGNAVKYADPDRPASVDVVVRADAEGEHVHLEVADRGLGIPAGELGHVFEPFRRAHGGGTSGSGLGLAICHSVVTRHGGTIAARQRPGGGTVVEVALPATAVDDGDAPAIAPAYDAAT